MNLAILENRLRHPMQFEEDFYNFFKDLDIATDIEKTLAEQTRFDSRTLILGVNEFFKTNPVAEQSNLNQFIPPEAEHQLITSIRIWTAVSATINDVRWSLGVSTPFASSARITITNNGVKALDSVPLSEFIEEGGMTTRDAGTYYLAEPIPWVGQTKLIVTIETIGTLAVNNNLRVGLKGLAYIS